jgi:type I restriction enzyme R subunit
MAGPSRTRPVLAGGSVKPDEAAFESFICDTLIADGGYDTCKVGNAQSGVSDFDPVRGLDTAELFAFLGATQADNWEELKTRLGGEADAAQAKFADRLASEIDKRGTVDVLRHGVADHGVTIQLAYFKPAHGLTPDLVKRYGANRLTVIRQLPYEAGSTKTVDLALFINGIPVATAELKNHLTGQSVENAIGQYRTDRDPGNRTLSKRAVVHFAVDTEAVAMTTRLAGRATRFLPFNRGHNRGAGNPANEDGHRTSYLWEQVWQRDAWLDLFARFVHVEKPSKGSKAPAAVIFPRFHQWDAVRRLEAAARDEGAGQKYLVQHSAGSGKSNTIAWLAHRLSNLHDDDNNKVFDKVVVITDRVVLDRQLQDTIYQFEHAHGVVERIESNSQQLADALAGEQARIIITTLQKFPYVLDKIDGLPARSYAVIVDEAHSSQTGEAAKELKRVLGAAGGEDTDVEPGSVEEALAEEVAARGTQSRSRRPRRARRWSCSGGSTRPRTVTSPTTSTRCAKPSTKASSRTCWPTTRRMRCSSTWRRPSLTIPATKPVRPGRRSPSSWRCTTRTSIRRRRSWSSTSVPMWPGRSGPEPRPWWSAPPVPTR